MALVHHAELLTDAAGLKDALFGRKLVMVELLQYHFPRVFVFPR